MLTKIYDIMSHQYINMPQWVNHLCDTVLWDTMVTQVFHLCLISQTCAGVCKWVPVCSVEGILKGDDRSGSVWVNVHKCKNIPFKPSLTWNLIISGRARMVQIRAPIQYKDNISRYTNVHIKTWWLWVSFYNGNHYTGKTSLYWGGSLRNRTQTSSPELASYRIWGCVF